MVVRCFSGCVGIGAPARAQGLLLSINWVGKYKLGRRAIKELMIAPFSLHVILELAHLMPPGCFVTQVT